MINIIEAELYMFGEDQVLLTSIAKGILDRIEECEMLPPFNQHDFHMDGDKADYKSITYRTWEEE